MLKKINGQETYQLARNNQEILLKEIEVEALSIKNVIYNYPC